MLAWNIMLTVVLILALASAFLAYNNYKTVTESRILVVTESLQEMNDVMSQQAQVINQHALVINEHTQIMDEEYFAVIEANQADMARLITEYQQMIDANNTYLTDLLESLEELSMVVTY
jgi:hypothetical protein